MPQCMYVHHVCTGAQGGQKVRTIELELQSSESTARAPNLWALCADFPASPSPHPETFFFVFFWVGEQCLHFIKLALNSWPSHLNLPRVGLQAWASNHDFTDVSDNSTGYFPSTSSQCVHKWQLLLLQICLPSHVPKLNEGDGNLFKWSFVFGDPQEQPQFQRFPRRMPRAGEGCAAHWCSFQRMLTFISCFLTPGAGWGHSCCPCLPAMGDRTWPWQ